MCLIDIAALSLTHLNKMLNQKFAIVFANTPSFIKALIRIEGKFLLGCLKIFGLFLQHVSESCLLTRCQLVLYLFDVCNAPFACVTPLRVILTPK